MGVDGVDWGELAESPEGYRYVTSLIPPERLSLVRRDVQPESTEFFHPSH